MHLDAAQSHLPRDAGIDSLGVCACKVVSSVCGKKLGVLIYGGLPYILRRKAIGVNIRSTPGIFTHGADIGMNTFIPHTQRDTLHT